MNESNPENNIQEVSKSQLKREANEVLDLAKKMLAMPEPTLNGLPLDPELREAVDFARGIRAHGARKRQLMTVAKLLRKRDNTQILEAINNLDQKNRQMNARFHHVEAWRDRLLEGDDQQLAQLLDNCPGVNVQTLRQLIRNAKKEAKLGKPPAAARKLFRFLREADVENQLPPLP
jgi:ribosome-associated protein